MNYSEQNKNTYNDLAEEYESRVETLLPVTKVVIDLFSKHIQPKGSVLDIGCAVGIALSVLEKSGFETTGVEISPKMAQLAKERSPSSRIIVGDFNKQEFDEKYDAVLAFAFIHLFPKQKAILIFQKIKNVLKSDGVALISTTESKSSSEGWETKEDFSTKRKRFRKRWTEKELRDFLVSLEFEIVELAKFKDPFGKTWMDFVIRSK